MKSIFKNTIIAAGLVFGAASISNAQVKIGANPNSIGTNSNLEVEAVNGNKTIVNKATGQVTIQDGTQGVSKVLTSDANGVASWQASSTQTAQSIVSASSSTVQQVNLGANYLSFNTESIDRNNDFDTSTGIFTAPTDGLYLVNVYIRISGQLIYQLGRIRFDAEAEVVGSSIFPLCSGIAYENDWGFGSGSRMLSLTAGQQVRIRFFVSPGNTTGQSRTLDNKLIEFTKISN